MYYLIEPRSHLCYHLFCVATPLPHLCTPLGIVLTTSESPDFILGVLTQWQVSPLCISKGHTYVNHCGHIQDIKSVVLSPPFFLSVPLSNIFFHTHIKYSSI